MFSIIGSLFLFELLVAVSGQSYSSRRCSSSRFAECRKALEDSIGKRLNDMNRQDMGQHCGVVREDFNCMLREMRCLSESERQRNADVLRKAYTYIRDGCDSLGNSWKDISCFTGDAMKNCEDSYPVNNGQYSSYTPEACRKYNLYVECVRHVMKNRCRPEDDQHLGQFLVTKTQDLAWNCGDTDSDRSRDRDYDKERDYGRNYGYDNDRNRDRDRDRDYDRDRNRDQWRSQSDLSSDRYGDRSYDRNQPHDRYDNATGSRGRDSHLGIGGITCCKDERCDSNRMQQCRNSLTRTVDDRNGGYQDNQKCRKARDDFNCLLWQSSCLPREERDRNSDLFNRAKDYISRNCDTYGRWSENSCFKSSEMQRCETELSTTRGGANYESCRAFNTFRDCMTNQLTRRCTREDELLQGAYMVDKAQEMSWQCGNDNIRIGTYDRSRDRDRDRDDSYRGRMDDRDRGDGRYPYDTYGSSSQYGSADARPHLDDDDAMCQSRMQAQDDTCRNEMNEKRRRLLTEHNYDLKQKGDCCAAIMYRRCLLDASRRTCNKERGRVVESLLGRQRYEISSDKCRNFYERECSAASAISFSAILLLLGLASFFLA